MTTVGPWIQEPDYEVTTQNAGTGAANSRRANMLVANGFYPNVQQDAEYMEYTSGWFPIVDDTMTDLVEAAENAVDLNREIVGDPTMRTTRLTRIHETGTIGEDNWGSGAAVSMNRYPWLIPPGTYTAGALGWSPFYFEPDNWPENAVGIEYDNEAGEGIAEGVSVRVLANTVFEGVNLDNSAHLGQDLTAPPVTRLLAQTPEQFNASDGPGTEFLASEITLIAPGSTGATSVTLGEDFDLTPYMTPVGMVLSTFTDSFIPPQNDDTYSGFSLTNYWEYGYAIDLIRVGWTLRPPRYRWIYDTTTPTYRRIYPRDDGLAGGAPRNWPPSKGVQTSNRTSGYL